MRTTIKETIKICLMSCSVILFLFGMMLFSPLSTQFREWGGAGRGISCESDINQLLDEEEYQAALDLVNSEIEENSEDLPRFAYFDRFLSQEKRYEASLARMEIYELQWKRIEILSVLGDEDLLRKSLKEYVHIIGYHQEEASLMLNEMEGK